MSNRVAFKLFITLILVLGCVYGCAPVEQEPIGDTAPVAEVEVAPVEVPEEVEVAEEIIGSAELKLSFVVADVSTYKVSTVSRKKYKYEEPANDKVTEKNTETMYEVIFSQVIESIDEAGAATAVITINEIAVRSADKAGFVTSFNTSDGKDPEIPLMKLIGQSYTIKILSFGTVEVVDAAGIQAAADGSTGRHKITMGLVKDEELIKRHEVFALPSATNSGVEVGGSWSKLRNSPPGMLQAKTFELIYTLEEVKGQVAAVAMEAIPSDKNLDDLPDSAEGMGAFMNMFDIQESYIGRMEFDINDGRVMRFSEQLRSDWVAVEPMQGEAADGEAQPSALTMGFEYDYSVERLDVDSRE